MMKPPLYTHMYMQLQGGSEMATPTYLSMDSYLLCKERRNGLLEVESYA
jgi:hypothetical protein